MKFNSFQNFKEINWLGYAIELVVVILGVSIAFMLDNWKENKKNIELENNFLTSFQSDLVKDQKNLETVISFEEKSLKEIEKIVTKYAKGTEVKEEEVFSVVQSMLSFSFINANNSTIEFVKNNGNLGIIKNYKLKEKFISYYKEQNDVKNVELAESNFVNSFFLPYFNENFDILSERVSDKKTLNSTEFKNIIAGTFVLKQQTLEFTKKLLNQNEELRKDLEKELKERF